MLSRFRSFAVAAALSCAAISTAQAGAREESRLLVATEVMEELRASRDQFIPDRLLERAYGIAVIPDVTKVAFFAGGRRGRGVLVVRDKDGHFTNPAFITLTGGSIGWQIGAQSTDVVLVFTTRTGIEGISGGKLTLGADASVAAGPVGRQASAATDTSFSAEVYSYSRTRGLFAGVALDGSALNIDRSANAAFYGSKGSNASTIFNGGVTTNSETVRRFLAAIATSTGGSAPGTSAATAPPPLAPSATTSPTPAGAAQSFPLEDQQPGSEPPN